MSGAVLVGSESQLLIPGLGRHRFSCNEHPSVGERYILWISWFCFMALAEFFAAWLFQGVFFILRWPAAMYFSY